MSRLVTGRVTAGERCQAKVVRTRNHFLEKTKPVNLLNCRNEMIVPLGEPRIQFASC